MYHDDPGHNVPPIKRGTNLLPAFFVLTIRLSFRCDPLPEQIVFIDGPTLAQGVANGKSGHFPCLTKGGIYDALHHNDIQWNHTTLPNLSNFGQTAI
jgi:hypothetical protein